MLNMRIRRRIAAPSFGLALLAACSNWQDSPDIEPGYRDLNRNGRLDPYENPRLGAGQRVDDLLARMTTAEKVALMLHGTLPGDSDRGFGMGSRYDRAAAASLIASGVNSFITRLSTDPLSFAVENNAIQKIAEQSRLGIPVTISTDPRHHFHEVTGASSRARGFSQWPEPLGFAALDNERLIERFGRLAAQEYRAVGIQMALSPQADLFTEPRWPRGTQTFGSDPETVSRLAGAYVRGFQGATEGVTRQGVATVAKHWAGYGAQPEGFDGHNYYGRTAELDTASFEQHVAAFDGVLRARTAGIMPTYVIPKGAIVDGKPVPPVGGGFNKPLLTDLLRRQKGYDGLVISDWRITDDCPEACRNPTPENPQGFNVAMPWGVEDLPKEERFALGANAGIDQFGGVNDPAPLLSAVRAGKVPTARVDDAARRVLLLKFQLGLFDDPYVEEDEVAKIVGLDSTQREADKAQGAVPVLLENRGGLLPLAAAKRRVWLFGLSADAALGAGLTVVENLDEADIAILRVATPHEVLHPAYFFGSIQPEGRLDFRADDEATQAIKAAAAKVPAIVAVDLDRPAVLTAIRDDASALLGLFGASDQVVFDIVTGKAKPKGRLPFELPSSAQAVERQHPARPDDSLNPLYPRGFGLSYQ